MLHTFGNRTVKLNGPGNIFPESTKNKIPIIEYVNFFTMVPIRQFVSCSDYKSHSARPGRAKSSRTVGFMIFHVYVHGECQSDRCKMKEIWGKL